MVSVKLLGLLAMITLAIAANNKNNAAGNGNNNNNNNNNNNGGGGGGSSNSLTLDASVLSKGSEVDGQSSEGAESGQTASETSDNNFIDFCEGQTITNGLQLLGGSCNPIPMGKLPAKNTMISTILLNPKNGDVIKSGETFNITLQVNNLQAGDFTNADASYYSAPQDLNGQGQVIGHTHVTVQDLGGSLNPSQPPDPTQFAFFKGINDNGNGKGLLSAEVLGGLPPGNYRVCTLTAASNHQPVIMPVAQRGSQDDCNKFTVNGNNNTINAAANDGSKGEAAAAAAASAVALGPGAVTAGSGAAASSSTSSASSGNNGKDKGNGKGNGNNGKDKASTTADSKASTTTAASKDAGGKGGSKGAGGKGGNGKDGEGKGGNGKFGSSGGAKASTSGKASSGGKSSNGKNGEKRDCGPERLARRRRFVS